MSHAVYRTAFAGFGLVTVGVLANLFLMQPKPDASRADTLGARPAPPTLALEQFLTPSSDAKRATAKPSVPRTSVVPPQHMQQGVERYARLWPDSARANTPGDTLPDAPDAEGEASTIIAVQRELAERGYGPLTVNGVPGPVTRAAIMAYEADHQMPLKGEATAALLARIVLGISGPAAPEPGAGKVRSPEAEIVVRTVQQSLANLGYDVGKIDGKIGDEITRAIREFEVDQGLKQTGRVSAEIMTRLARAVQLAKPKSTN